MKISIRKLTVWAAAAALAQGAAAQSLRIEAESGAAGLLRVAAAEYKAFPYPIDIASTTGAIRKLCRGEIAGAGAARTVTKAERDACSQEKKVELVELPLGLDAIVAVVNPTNTWAKRITLPELARGWTEAPGKAASWQAMNAQWPASALKLYGPGANLGLAVKYQDVLSGSGQKAVLRADFTSTEVLSVVADAVARDQAALGILDWATYSGQMKRVRALPIELGGRAVQPTPAALRDGSYGALTYPMTLHVNRAALKDPGFKEFLLHLAGNGARLAGKAGLVPMAAADYARAREQLARP